MERCPTTGQECPTLTSLVTFEEAILLSEGVETTPERRQAIQEKMAKLVRLGQKECDTETCGVISLGATLAIATHASRTAKTNQE